MKAILIIYFISPNIPKILSFHHVINNFKVINEIFYSLFFFQARSLKPGVHFTLTTHLDLNFQCFDRPQRTWLVAPEQDNAALQD